MAVPVIEAGADSGATTVTSTVTINLGTNANRALWAQLADVTALANTITAATLDGVDCMASLVGPTSMGGYNVYNLHHVTTLTGSKVLSTTWASNGFKSMIAVALSGADQTTPFSGRQTQYNAAGTNPSLTVTSSTDSIVLMGVQSGSGGTLTPGTSSSHISGIAANFRYGLNEAGASSVTIDGTFASQQYWASGVSALGITGGGGSGLDIPRNLSVSQAAGRASNF